MQTERPAFLALMMMIILSLFDPVLLRHRPKLALFPRRLDSSATRKASSSSRPTSPVDRVTRVQLEDLDDAAATSADCLRLRQLDLCDRGRRRRPSSSVALSYSSAAVDRSNSRPAQRALLSLLDDSPSSCRRFLRPFLCVALAPNCSFSGNVDVPAALPPCRTMCLTAAERCRGVLLDARGIDWPAEWTCEQFPVDGLCLDQPPRHDTGD